MRVLWTTTAAGDLAHIVEYIRKDNPAAARRVAQTIYGGVAALRTFPHRGRVGLVENTRVLGDFIHGNVGPRSKHEFTPWLRPILRGVADMKHLHLPENVPSPH